MEFTKGRLRACAREKVKSLEFSITQTAFADSRAELEEELELARIALASLEAEAVAVRARWKDEVSGHGNWKYYDIAHRYSLMADESRDCELIYTAPPETVSVPDDIPDSVYEVLCQACGGGEKACDFADELWNACRAAMLQGSEPVTTAYKLPDDFDLDRFNDVVWLEAVASNPHMHSLTTSTIAMVALELNRKLADRNSTVIQDGWVMVPVEPTAEMLQSGISAHYERSQIQIHDRPAPGPMECAYAAMLAAAPQQEVKA